MSDVVRLVIDVAGASVVQRFGAYEWYRRLTDAGRETTSTVAGA